MTAEPEFTPGIEEEYFLVDRATRDVVGDPPDGMPTEFEALLGAHVSPEFLRSQIEIGTRVCASLGEARDELRRLRGGIGAVAARHGPRDLGTCAPPEDESARERGVDEIVEAPSLCTPRVPDGVIAPPPELRLSPSQVRDLSDAAGLDRPAEHRS